MTHEFFLVTLPGLEDLVVDEVSEWCADLVATPAHGGVVITTTLARGLGLNRALKVPTRILVRVAKFRCRDFPKLYKTVAEIAWADFVSPAAAVEVHASTRGSRLKIKTRIAETCAEGWATARKRAGVAPDPAARVDLFARIVDDECVLSLDTSGERLHKRGVRTRVGEAPLRETIAAALLRLVERHAAATATEVVDPMAGSGTFLIEAATARTLVARDAFARFAAEPTPPPAVTARAAVRTLGLERDPATLTAARENLRGQSDVTLIAGDVFDADPLPAAAGARWLLVNPPYGERLKVDDPLPAYYAKLFATCERWARPDFACALLPQAGARGKLALPPGWRVLEKRPFVNGGIPVVAFVFGRRA